MPTSSGNKRVDLDVNKKGQTGRCRGTDKAAEAMRKGVLKLETENRKIAQLKTSTTSTSAGSASSGKATRLARNADTIGSSQTTDPAEVPKFMKPTASSKRKLPSRHSDRKDSSASKQQSLKVPTSSPILSIRSKVREKGLSIVTRKDRPQARKASPSTIGVTNTSHPTAWGGRGLIDKSNEVLLESPDKENHSLGDMNSPADLSQSPELLVAAPHQTPHLTAGNDEQGHFAQATSHSSPKKDTPHTRPIRPLNFWRRPRHSQYMKSTPLYETPTGIELTRRLCSPGSTALHAPRRRPSTRAALLIGIASGNAKLLESSRNSFDEESNSLITVPSHLTVYFPRTMEEKRANTSQLLKPAIAVAVKSSSAAVVGKLIQLGADPLVIDADGRNLLHLIFLPEPGDLASPGREEMQRENLTPGEPFSQLGRNSPAVLGQARSSIVTPRIMIEDAHVCARTSTEADSGRCKNLILGSSFGGGIDNLSQIIEVLCSKGVDVTVKDCHGNVPSIYAKKWFEEACREAENDMLPFESRISAFTVRAAALTLLSLEDHLKLSILAPLTTSHEIKQMLQPRFKLGSTHYEKLHPTADQAIIMVNQRSLGKGGKREAVATKRDQSLLKSFIDFGRANFSNPAVLGVFEFLGASFSSSPSFDS